MTKQSNIDAGGPAFPQNELSSVVITLLKGVVYRDDNPGVWNALLNLQSGVRDYVAVIGLELTLDEAEGYAFLRSIPENGEGDKNGIPRLAARRRLSYPVSLMLALLRKKLAEFDAGGDEIRLILSREDVVELIRIFLPEGSNEVKLTSQVDAMLNKIAELGFIRRLRGEKNMIEVRRIIKAYIDAQWLAEFDERLAEYRRQLEQPSEDVDG